MQVEGLRRWYARFREEIKPNAFEQPLFAAMVEIALLNHGRKVEALPLRGVLLA